MTESARREANRCNGLEGHNCCRPSLRRSDLFSRQSDSVQFLVGGARSQLAAFRRYAAFGMSS